jgi:hypothetical protein
VPASVGLTPAQEGLQWLLGLVRKGRELHASDLAASLKMHPVLEARLVRLFEGVSGILCLSLVVSH